MKTLLVQTNDGTVLVDGVKLIEMMDSVESLFADIRTQLAQGQPYNVEAVSVDKTLVNPFAGVVSQLEGVLEEDEPVQVKKKEPKVKNEVVVAESNEAEVTETIVDQLEKAEGLLSEVDELMKSTEEGELAPVGEDESPVDITEIEANDEVIVAEVDEKEESIAVVDTSESEEIVSEEESEEPIVGKEVCAVSDSYLTRDLVVDALEEWPEFRSNGRLIQPKWDNIRIWSQKVEKDTGYVFTREGNALQGLTEDELALFKQAIELSNKEEKTNVLPTIKELFSAKV